MKPAGEINFLRKPLRKPMRRLNAFDWNRGSNQKVIIYEDPACHEKSIRPIHDTIDPHQADFGPETAELQSLKSRPTVEHTPRNWRM